MNVTILTLSLSRPSLDDVILKYTGTSKDGTKEESGEERWKQWAGKGGGGKWAKQWNKWQEEGAAAEVAGDAGTASDQEQQQGAETSVDTAVAETKAVVLFVSFCVFSWVQ